MDNNAEKTETAEHTVDPELVATGVGGTDNFLDKIFPYHKWSFEIGHK